MGKQPSEWMNQADYDMDTADVMYQGGRYIYTVFMCHLAIEKALKGLYARTLDENPPNTHNLIFLVEKMRLELPEDMYDFVSTLSGVSIPTRYPDELQRIQKDYNKTRTEALLKKGREALQWLKARL